jgi:hypothetical protein
MQYIPISSPRLPGLRFAVDDADVELVAQRHWNMSHRYAYTATGPKHARRHLYAHSLICAPPEGMTVDHLDGDTFNNTRSNLEIVTHDENRRRNTRGANGVRFSPTLGLWIVFGRRKNNHCIISLRGTEEDAKSARIAYKSSVIA